MNVHILKLAMERQLWHTHIDMSCSQGLEIHSRVAATGEERQKKAEQMMDDGEGAGGHGYS